jgi:hypothetical protein
MGRAEWKRKTDLSCSEQVKTRLVQCGGRGEEGGMLSV